MFKYFVSFTHITNGKSGFGNAVLEVNHKITDFDNSDTMRQWVNDAQKWIERISDVKDVIILNFIFLE